jgi:hypothetical protein
LTEWAGVEESEPGGGEGPGRKRRKRAGGGQREGRRAQYWMIVTSPENFRRTLAHDFSIQGITTRNRKRVETMHAGDRLLYYVTGRMAFAATATLTSNMYEDHQLIWRSGRREEDYPWRVHVRPDLVLEEPDWVVAKELAFRLDYVRKWPPEHWTLAFQGQLHQLPQKDFKLIEDELSRSQRRRSVAS